MGSTFGTLFRATTFGESHGGGVGVVVDGCPSLLPLDESDIQPDLERRRPGQSRLTTQRKEADKVEILSGTHEGRTLGTPVAMLVRNSDARASDYEEVRTKYRPSHADFAYDEKYGARAWQGGGRASARETVGRVAAGAVARKLLSTLWGVEAVAWVESVHDLVGRADPGTVTRADVDAHPVRCPDPDAAARMAARIEEVRKEGDSVGGTVACVLRNVPAGWGEPVADKAEAELAKAMLSLPASKGFEVGSGFAGARMRGSEHNDAYRADDSRRVTTPTNWSGGIQGGITNGMPIVFRVAFKPVATIPREQDTVDVERRNTTISGRGRHDPCVLPRAVPMVEAMALLVLADLALRQETVRLDRLGRRADTIP